MLLKRCTILLALTSGYHYLANNLCKVVTFTTSAQTTLKINCMLMADIEALSTTISAIFGCVTLVISFPFKTFFLVHFQSQGRLQLQLAPSLEHQVAAMLSILARYNWQQFSVVTSEIAGHDDFVQAVRDRVALMKSQEIFR